MNINTGNWTPAPLSSLARAAAVWRALLARPLVSSASSSSVVVVLVVEASVVEVLVVEVEAPL